MLCTIPVSVRIAAIILLLLVPVVRIVTLCFTAYGVKDPGITTYKRTVIFMRPILPQREGDFNGGKNEGYTGF
jgi:hypothetical protein